MHFPRCGLSAALLAAMLLPGWLLGAVEPVWPAARWATRTPSEVGLDEAQLGGQPPP
jgi:hypothetical protein